jgi:hypothetical protein
MWCGPAVEIAALVFWLSHRLTRNVGIRGLWGECLGRFRKTRSARLASALKADRVFSYFGVCSPSSGVPLVTNPCSTPHPTACARVATPILR